MRNIDVDFDDSINVTEYNTGLGYTFTIPSAPNFRGDRYVIRLPEIPYLKDPTKLPIILGMTRVEGIQPNTSEFRTTDVANSDIRIAPHLVEFHADQAGQTKTIFFWSFGSIVDIELPNSNSTVTVGKNRPFLDYECNGVNDTNQIQAAIDYVDSIGGGEVKILEGTFNIDAQLEMKQYIKLTGAGMNTVLKRTSNLYSTFFNIGLNETDLEISNLRIDINGTSIPITINGFSVIKDISKTTYSHNKYKNIKIENTIDNNSTNISYGLNVEYCEIENIIITNSLCYTFYCIFSNYSTIYNCRIYSNIGRFYIACIYGTDNIISMNDVYNNQCNSTSSGGSIGIRSSDLYKTNMIYNNRVTNITSPTITSGYSIGIFESDNLKNNVVNGSTTANYHTCCSSFDFSYVMNDLSFYIGYPENPSYAYHNTRQHNLIVGDIVYFKKGIGGGDPNLPSPLVENVGYYAIPINYNQFYIASSYNNAINNIRIVLFGFSGVVTPYFLYTLPTNI